MNAIPTPRVRRRAAGAALAAAVVAVLTGCSIGSSTAETTTAASSSSTPSSPSVKPSSARGLPVVLQFGDHAANATLADTPTSRDLASTLPLTIELNDAWGQAKAGPLPHPLSVAGTLRVREPIPGGIYYWPSTAALAVYYDDLGQSVPPPGLLPLGVVDGGLDELADAGRHVTIRLRSAAGTHA